MDNATWRGILRLPTSLISSVNSRESQNIIALCSHPVKNSEWENVLNRSLRGSTCRCCLRAVGAFPNWLRWYRSHWQREDSGTCIVPFDSTALMIQKKTPLLQNPRSQSPVVPKRVPFASRLLQKQNSRKKRENENALLPLLQNPRCQVPKKVPSTSRLLQKQNSRKRGKTKMCCYHCSKTQGARAQ